MNLSPAHDFMDGLKNYYGEHNADFQRLEDIYGTDTFRPDHCAMRTISGIGFGPREAELIFGALGWRLGRYWPIPDKHIMACHFEPPDPTLEKIFFSEIILKDFLPIVQTCVRRMMPSVREIVDDIISWLRDRRNITSDTMECLISFFTERPSTWSPHPSSADYFVVVNHLDSRGCKDGEQIASVARIGFRPNHFTILMKDPNYIRPGYTTMREFTDEMTNLGFNMKEEVEGAEESKLCQTSTLAVNEPFRMLDDGKNVVTVMQPGTYIEFIRRGIDLKTKRRYEGFEPQQATKLFEMTNRR